MSTIADDDVYGEMMTNLGLIEVNPGTYEQKAQGMLKVAHDTVVHLVEQQHAWKAEMDEKNELIDKLMEEKEQKNRELSEEKASKDGLYNHLKEANDSLEKHMETERQWKEKNQALQAELDEQKELIDKLKKEKEEKIWEYFEMRAERNDTCKHLHEANTSLIEHAQRERQLVEKVQSMTEELEKVKAESRIQVEKIKILDTAWYIKNDELLAVEEERHYLKMAVAIARFDNMRKSNKHEKEMKQMQDKLDGIIKERDEAEKVYAHIDRLNASWRHAKTKNQRYLNIFQEKHKLMLQLQAKLKDYEEKMNSLGLIDAKDEKKLFRIVVKDFQME